jgi:catechol 2,3-dioxygenase-like lactoylglutathione lyase family enzyme
MIFDHVNLHVRDLARSVAFYADALKPLGIVVAYQDEHSAGLGPPGQPQLWLQPAATVQPIHLALAAGDRGQVREFHRAALAAGARDNGEPGLRAHYHPSYYAAFVLDPDGHNLEAVCHAEAAG